MCDTIFLFKAIVIWQGIEPFVEFTFHIDRHGLMTISILNSPNQLGVNEEIDRHDASMTLLQPSLRNPWANLAVTFTLCCTANENPQ